MEQLQETGFVQRVFESRAVVRLVEAGNIGSCALCGADVTFKANNRGQKQVIANVYVDGAWNRVEYYHNPCYENADQPYGKAL